MLRKCRPPNQSTCGQRSRTFVDDGNLICLSFYFFDFDPFLFFAAPKLEVILEPWCLSDVTAGYFCCHGLS